MGNKYETDLNPTSLETVYPKDFLDVVKKYDLIAQYCLDRKENEKITICTDDFGHNDTIDINELFKDNSEIVSNDVSMFDMLHEMNDRINGLESEVKKLNDIINNK